MNNKNRLLRLLGLFVFLEGVFIYAFTLYEPGDIGYLIFCIAGSAMVLAFTIFDIWRIKKSDHTNKTTGGVASDERGS